MTKTGKTKVTMKDVADLTAKTVAWLGEACSRLSVPVGVQTLHSVRVVPVLVGDALLPGFGSEVLWFAWADGPAGPQVCVTRERYDVPIYCDSASIVRNCETGEEVRPLSSVTCPWRDADPYTKFCTGLDAYRLAAAAWNCLSDIAAANPDDTQAAERAQGMFGVACALVKLAAASAAWHIDTHVNAAPTRQLSDAAAFTQAAFTRPGAC